MSNPSSVIVMPSLGTTKKSSAALVLLLLVIIVCLGVGIAILTYSVNDTCDLRRFFGDKVHDYMTDPEKNEWAENIITTFKKDKKIGGPCSDEVMERRKKAREENDD